MEVCPSLARSTSQRQESMMPMGGRCSLEDVKDVARAAFFLAATAASLSATLSITPGLFAERHVPKLFPVDMAAPATVVKAVCVISAMLLRQG